MKLITISDEVQQLCPNLQLGCISFDINYSTASSDLQTYIKEVCLEIQDKYTTAEITQIPPIKSARQSYRALGKEPSRYRLSAEALLRRIVKGKGLYQISTAVDILNLISIQTGYSIGGYDCAQIGGDILLRKGTSEDAYEAIGKGDYNIANLPVLADDKGGFGTPTSDSNRTMFTKDTTSFLMVFFDFEGSEHLMSVLEEAIELYQSFTTIDNVQKVIF
jgi:DNA/RNA-binding domain of Phe-tRNA-synthetase-like protein